MGCAIDQDRIDCFRKIGGNRERVPRIDVSIHEENVGWSIGQIFRAVIIVGVVDQLGSGEIAETVVANLDGEAQRAKIAKGLIGGISRLEVAKFSAGLIGPLSNSNTSCALGGVGSFFQHILVRNVETRFR